MRDGREFKTEDMAAAGDPERPLSDDEIDKKFLANAGQARLGDRAVRIRQEIRNLGPSGSVRTLLDLTLAPLPDEGGEPA
jgi:hypothetical protein